MRFFPNFGTIFFSASNFVDEITRCNYARQNLGNKIHRIRPANRNFGNKIAFCKLQTGISATKSLPASCNKQFCCQADLLQACSKEFRRRNYTMQACGKEFRQQNRQMHISAKNFDGKISNTCFRQSIFVHKIPVAERRQETLPTKLICISLNLYYNIYDWQENSFIH